MPAPLPTEQVLSEQDFLDLFARLYPENYLTSLKTGNGYELFQAFAAMGARISLAKARVNQQAFKSSATGGAYATGVVNFSRPALDPPGTEPALTLRAGTCVKTSRGGRVFVTTEDVVWTLGELGPKEVPVRAQAQGYEWNVPGEVTTAGGEVLPGEIDTVDFLNEYPPVEDVTFTVSQTDPTEGGQPAALDQLGQDLGLPRNPGEADDPYRLRISRLPDTVTPSAIVKALNTYLAAYDVAPGFIETFDQNLTGCYDYPGDTDAVFVPDYDPPGSTTRNRIPDQYTAWGAFVVTLPVVILRNPSFAFDDPAVTLADLVCPAYQNAPLPDHSDQAGRRGIPAPDLPQSYDDLLPGVYSGEDPYAEALYAGVVSLVAAIKAAGVAVIYLRQE